MSEVIRLSLDTEFNEDVDYKNITKIDFMSIGLVNVDDPADGGFYAVSSDFKADSVNNNDFVKEQVLPKLYMKGAKKNIQPMSDRDIGHQMYSYIQNIVHSSYSKEELMDLSLNVKKHYDNPTRAIEFWAKNGSYDNYLLCRLSQGMQELKNTWRMYGAQVHFRDLNELKTPSPEFTHKPVADESRLHNAFYDACHQAEIIRWVEAGNSSLTPLGKKFLKGFQAQKLSK